MILDNENQNPKVHEWITQYTQNGTLSIVTGYFTIGALAYLSQQTNEKIKEYKFILGDIVNFDIDKDRALDLLNENISIEAALRLSKIAQEAVAFLELDKVEAKTLEPNFCHAKMYLFKNEPKNPQLDYYISGSSNLTEAGIGLKTTNNVELNIANFGADPQYNELTHWFDTLWNKPQAHLYKTIENKDGKTHKIPFKQYLIDEIKKIFTEYSPKELYYKVLFELFDADVSNDLNNPEFNRQLGKLENTLVYKSLYDFQQKGVLSLIKMLQKYNGAILADAVGLGKTWSALAVIKFFELQGHKTILLCPKKLEQNWSKFLEHDSKFASDGFKYKMRFHTDLADGRWDSYKRHDSFTIKNMLDSSPKLIVIDESHNLRNDKSNRYKYLVEEILKKAKGDIKVLMLSATPINNNLNDIRNQFKLMVRGDVKGFQETLDVKNIDYIFRTAQKSLNEWASAPQTIPDAFVHEVPKEYKISTFIKTLPTHFFTLTDALTVARTRKMIEGHQNGLVFPKKEKPENIFVTPVKIGNYDSFNEIFQKFPPLLSGYQPAFYIDDERPKTILTDEKQRDRFLVKMMYILLVKRLESSWSSFYSTVNKILTHHQNALEKIRAYQETKSSSSIESEVDSIMGEDEDEQDIFDKLSLGKRQIKLADIDRCGNLESYKSDLKRDIEALEALQNNLIKFEVKISKELSVKNNHKSDDEKLQALIQKINEKRARGANNMNQKVVIFTTYRDTAFYLYHQLKERGFDKIAALSGSGSLCWDQEGESNHFEHILERFAPFTKLFNEKMWEFTPTGDNTTENYEGWKNWIAINDSDTHHKLTNPIDIIIATDALSEGQNLQDCDLVINYDIHWNPVRIIQRMGRIDRLGSPNSTIYGINFWPSDNINEYLDLKGRIEKRMATMKLAGSEVNLEFTDSFKEMAESEELEQKQNERMLRQMQSTWDEIEVSDSTIGFDSFSLETFRQDLVTELNANKDKYRQMPNGVYTGFVGQKEHATQEGLIALLGYPAKQPKALNHKYASHELIYINFEGRAVLVNQKEVLDLLAKHKEEVRKVDTAIDHGKPEAIAKLATAINLWLKNQSVTEEVKENGTVVATAGQASLDMFAKIKAGSKKAIDELKREGDITNKFTSENYDLITWFVVS